VPGLTDSQIAGLKTLFAVATDAVVRNLELALAEDAARGGPIAAVHQMAAEEARDRRVRGVVLGPVARLCRRSSWGTVAFPAAALSAVWRGLKDAESAQVRAAEEATSAPRGAGEPTPAVFDELCLAAAQGLRNEARSFQAANAVLNRSGKDGGAVFAGYLDLCPIAREALVRLPDWIMRMSDERAAAARLAYKDAVALADDAGPQYFEILFAHLAEPWQILRLMSAIMDHPGDKYAASSELARFGDYILGDIDKRLAAFRAFDPAEGAGAGVAAGVGAGCVPCVGGDPPMGVTTRVAVTAPFTPFFWTLPIVPRALRVASRLATATAFCSAVNGVRALGGASPKSASTSAEVPYVPRMTVVNAVITAIWDGAWARSVWILAFVAAFDASTASRLSTKSCINFVNAVAVKVAPPTVSVSLPFG
jgi:hypothetical protein